MRPSRDGSLEEEDEEEEEEGEIWMFQRGALRSGR